MQFSSDLGSTLYPLDTKSNDLQQVAHDYYDMHTKEAMTQLGQQASKILYTMYNNMTNQNVDKVSESFRCS